MSAAGRTNLEGGWTSLEGVVWSLGSREFYWFSQAGVGLELPDKQPATLGSAAILSEWLGVQGEAGGGGGCLQNT